ncbi:phage tail protein [Palleronia caenipelagi]|uniref:Phage tail fibre protein N-terminal domain-containing protein n=1 Tax=Palleronia caenipelagi TaxID=2489174 RepID=A0A547PS51_9RHOB|nr:phage tail protein [Palleronia caenipelagi]TRD16969.1 hypothetical protein FEV53_13615 [Palleronia caenipelagi]
MAADPYTPILTEAGFAAALAAVDGGFQVDITHVAVGAAGYTVAVNGAGRSAAVALQDERQRVAIQDAREVGGGQTDISFVLEDDGTSFYIREVGFYLADGTLFALASHPTQALMWKSDATRSALALELVLAGVDPAAVTIVATGPALNLLMTEEFARLLEGQAQLSLVAFQTWEAFYAAHSIYPNQGGPV